MGNGGWFISGVSKLRPAKPFCQWWKNIIKYTYEKFVGLEEYNIFRNNHIAQDVRPSSCSVWPYVALGQKSLENPGLYDQTKEQGKRRENDYC